MGLLDKMKDQASQALEKATQATVAGQAKLDSLATKRKIDSLLREIGLAFYRDRISEQPLNQADIDNSVSQISQIEQSSGVQAGLHQYTEEESDDQQS